MSQIAAHFGGSGSHSMSEYYALAGKGVSGIPSSGSISFSHFHGKSNQVTTSVWVSSGYNQTTNTFRGTYGGYHDWGVYWVHYNNSDQTVVWKSSSGPTYINSGGYFNVGNRVYSKTFGNYIINRGRQRSSSRSGANNFHEFHVYEQTTSWVDTSGYQNQTTTAQITT